MEDRVQQFLASGKLEEFVFGMLDPKDQGEVLDFIKKHPEVKKEYEAIQKQLESVSRKQAMKAPIGMKSKILDSLPDKGTSATISSSTSWTTYISIAGLAASLFFAWGWFQANEKVSVEKENYATLVTDCEEKDRAIEAKNNLIAFLNSEQTRLFELKGNDLAPSFNARVFVNDGLGKAILTPISKANLPKEKCLQLWGDLDGEMIPIAVLDDPSKTDYDLEINPAFTSLNLTIEEKTADGKGQDHPDVSQLIASVAI